METIEMTTNENGTFTAINPESNLSTEVITTQEGNKMRTIFVYESNLLSGYDSTLKAREYYSMLIAMFAEDGIENYLAHFQTSSLWPCRVLKNGSVKPWGTTKALDETTEGITEKERHFVRAYINFDQWIRDNAPKAKRETQTPVEPTEPEENEEILDTAANMNQFDVLRDMFLAKGKLTGEVAVAISKLEMLYEAE